MTAETGTQQTVVVPRAQMVALQAIRRTALALVDAPYLPEHLSKLRERLADYYEEFEKR